MLRRFRAGGRSPSAQLAGLTDLLLSDRPLDALLDGVVEAVCGMPGVEGAAVVVPGPPATLAAWWGTPFSDEELRGVVGGAHPVRLAVSSRQPDGLHALALAPGGRPVGLLLVRGLPPGRPDRDLLVAFANGAALALERSQLRARAVEAEVLQETDRIRQTLTDAVSHDLRTPLSTIRAASAILRRDDGRLTGQECGELWQLVDNSAARLDRLVGGLLGVARYRTGALALDRSSCAIGPLIERAVSALGFGLQDRPVVVTVRPGAGAVDVDPLLAEQVLVNLMENADHYGPPGTPIRVEAEGAGGWVRVSVADEGPGVDPAHRASVFDGFVRHGPGGRAGLGLSIARTFVEAHGGRIWVDGTRFSFTLPLADATAPDAGISSDAGRAVTSSC